MNHASAAMLYISAVSQVVIFPLVLTYWQSDYLRLKVNKLFARAFAWARLQGGALVVLIIFALAIGVYVAFNVLWGLIIAVVGVATVMVSRLWRRRSSVWSATVTATQAHMGATATSWPLTWISSLSQGTKDGSNRVLTDSDGAVWLSSDNANNRPMLYFQLSENERKRLGRVSGAIAIVEIDKMNRDFRLQYDGEFPFMEAEKVPLEAAAGDRSVDVIFLIKKPRFSRRQQATADFRLNPVGAGIETIDAIDVQVRRVILLAAPK